MKTIVFIPANADNPAMIKTLALTLDEMQALVSGGEGGLVECVSLRGQALRGLDLWVSEEGLLLEYPTNERASVLAEDHIVGDVFITGGPDSEGDTKGLTNLQARGVMKLLAEYHE